MGKAPAAKPVARVFFITVRRSIFMSRIMADLQKNCQCMAFTAPFRFPPNYDVASPQRLYDADMPSFHAFDLIPSLQTTLKKEAFVTPTEIQELTIPSLLKGNSVVGVAETGSGKTLAYALP